MAKRAFDTVLRTLTCKQGILRPSQIRSSPCPGLQLRYVSSSTATTARKYPYWTEEEDRLLLTLKKEGKTASEIRERLPGKTYDSIRRRSSEQNHGKRIRTEKLRPVARPWTADEDAMLADLRGKNMKPTEIATFLPGRTPNAVRIHSHTTVNSRSITMTSHGRRWNDEDRAELIKLRHVEGLAFLEIARKLKRSATSVLTKYHRITELSSRPDVPLPNSWTMEEDKRLKQLYQLGRPHSETANIIGKRTAKAVQHRLERLGLLRKRHFVRKRRKLPLETIDSGKQDTD